MLNHQNHLMLNHLMLNHQLNNKESKEALLHTQPSEVFYTPAPEPLF